MAAYLTKEVIQGIKIGTESMGGCQSRQKMQLRSS